VLGIAGAHGTVHAVGHDNQVSVEIGLEVGHLLLEAEPHAEGLAAAVQDVEQPLAAEPREAVAGGGQHLPLVVDVDVVPVGEGFGDLGVGLAVGFGKVLQRGVGEHHAEAEGVVGTVPLDDEDVVGGVGLLHEDGEVEAGRPSADTHELHDAIVPEAAAV
jgi:hypothetical protein